MIIRWPFPNQLTQPSAIFRRLHNSAVGWSWFFNGLRLASGVLLLPLVLHKLPEAEFGMYYVFGTLIAIVPLVDFGFGPTIGRFISYAMGGAESIQAQGVAKPGSSTSPNYDLLWQLLFTTRKLYRYLTLVLLVVLGTWGTYMVELRIHETASPTLTRLAWAATLLSTLFDIYANWWGTFITNMNQVLPAVRIGVIAYFVRLTLTCVLLASGVGLLSMPIGAFCGSLIQRTWARNKCLRLLAGHPPPQKIDHKKLFAILWPNSWRLGVQFISGYMTSNANVQICNYTMGLGFTAQYGLSVQLMNVAVGMSAVWTSVKWPLVGQYLARHDNPGLRQILRPRVWLQALTVIVLASGVILFGPVLVQWFGHGKQMLPRGWLALLALDAFLFMQFNLWTTLLSLQNRLPYLWYAVGSNALSLVLSLTLIHFTSLGLGALVLGPLLAGSLFNYWYWPPFAVRSLGTSLFRFLFGGPRDSKADQAPTA